MFNLSIRMQAQISQSLQICGGMTESIFPQPEAWLLAKTDHQKALEILARNKKSKRYRSVMDFLFCEIFTEYKGHCFRFYKSNGPMLKDIIEIEQLVYFNNVLLKALELAYEYFCKKRCISWMKFRFIVLKNVA